MASAAPPAELKAIGPFLNRANELSKADPVIAYWCASTSLTSPQLATSC